MNLEAREEVRDLEGHRLQGVRAVHGVGLDGRGEVRPDRPRRGLAEVGGPHEIAPALDRALALQHHHQAGPLGHEVAEALEESLLAVDGIEAGGVLAGHVNQPRGQDLESGLLDAGHDLAHDALGHRVGLDDGERPLAAHPITRRTVAPMSAGLRTSVAPAPSRAFIFSAAVPLPPAMMAPACPMRRPGGAVWPQMKATTGLRTWALMNSAASSSAVPPISPIIMMARVPASSWKSRSTSTNVVPITADPHAGGLSDPPRAELTDDLVGQRPTARDDPHRARLMDVARHDADLGLPRRDRPWAVRADQTAGGGAQEVPGPHH